MKVRSRPRKHISWKMLGLEDKPSSCWTATFSGGTLYIIFGGVMIERASPLSNDNASWISTKLRVKDETSSGLPWGDIVASREGFRCITSQKIWKTNPPRQKTRNNTSKEWMCEDCFVQTWFKIPRMGGEYGKYLWTNRGWNMAVDNRSMRRWWLEDLNCGEFLLFQGGNAPCQSLRYCGILLFLNHVYFTIPFHVLK